MQYDALSRSTVNVSGILDHPLSRMMTAVLVARADFVRCYIGDGLLALAWMRRERASQAAASAADSRSRRTATCL